MIGTQNSFSLSVDKGVSSESTFLFFSNDGDVPLVWNFSIIANHEAVSWSLSVDHGELPGGSTQEIMLSVDPTNLQARDIPFVTRFSLNSTSPTPTPQPLVRDIPISAQVFVSATPDAQRSNVTLDDVSSFTASNAIGFTVVPVDSTGLVLLDASQVSYTANLIVSSTLQTLVCSVVYDTTVDSHRGECSPPALVAGAFAVEVRDTSGSLVGGQAHKFQISDCPATYVLNDKDFGCKCAAGAYDKGSECATCPAGTVAPVAGSLECDACPPRETSDSTRTRCDCEADYYRDGIVGECSLCPLSQVSCAWGSTVANWTLRPGVWRSDESSTDLHTCRFGAASCPGDTLDDADNCTARGFGDWPHCGCGYVGPTCAVCAREYFLDWSGDACAKCGARDGHTPSIVVGCLVVALGGIAVAFVRNAKSKNKGWYLRFKKFQRLGRTKVSILFFLCQVRIFCFIWRW